MAYSKNVELLEPIDLSEHLGEIELYLSQVCRLAGISKMQLDYWTNKAQIPTKGKKQRIYDMDAVETVMLIKQAKDKGLNLGAAIDAGRDGARQVPRGPAMLPKPVAPAPPPKPLPDPAPGCDVPTEQVLPVTGAAHINGPLDYPDKLPEALHSEIQLTNGPRG